MSEEQKQALINRCKGRIAFYKAAGDTGTFDADTLQLTEIALAALTAQPVKLPGKCKVSDRAHETRQAYAEGLNHGIELARNAIAEAGYQVEGE